jgi:hypothetical protein
MVGRDWPGGWVAVPRNTSTHHSVPYLNPSSPENIEAMGKVMLGHGDQRLGIDPAS